MAIVTFEEIRSNAEIKTYIIQANEALMSLGFTEHSFAHVTRCAYKASEILEKLGYPPRLCAWHGLPAICTILAM